MFTKFLWLPNLNLSSSRKFLLLNTILSTISYLSFRVQSLSDRRREKPGILWSPTSIQAYQSPNSSQNKVRVLCAVSRQQDIQRGNFKSNSKQSSILHPGTGANVHQQRIQSNEVKTSNPIVNNLQSFIRVQEQMSVNRESNPMR